LITDASFNLLNVTPSNELKPCIFDSQSNPFNMGSCKRPNVAQHTSGYDDGVLNDISPILNQQSREFDTTTHHNPKHSKQRSITIQNMKNGQRLDDSENLDLSCSFNKFYRENNPGILVSQPTAEFLA
jgi:hypothetical protein